MEEKLRQQTERNPNCIKVVFIGPESTGKTTLVEALSAHYKAPFVEEFSRVYASEKYALGETLIKDDVLPIGIGQMELENTKLYEADQLLLCDTDLLASMVYSEFYFDGFCPPEIKKFAIHNSYELYFLTYIDLPWKKDGIRDVPINREKLYQAFENALLEAKKPYVVVKGSKKERLKLCKNHIDTLIKNRF